MPVTISAAGSYLPAGRRSAADISALVAANGSVRLSAELIDDFTGIDTRSIAADGENASSLAVAAAADLAARHARSFDEVDLLVFASASRDMLEPATAHVVADALGLSTHCFDVTNACNSFLNGVDVAAAMIEAGRAHSALVVTGEIPSRVVRLDPMTFADLRDSFAGYTFGDAGGAVLLERTGHAGLVHLSATAHSEHWRLGGVLGGGSRHPRAWEHSYFTGSGHELKGVFEAIGRQEIDDLLTRTGTDIGDFRRVLVHQVTVPYTDRLVEVLGLREDQVVRTVQDVGNLASATLPVQLTRAWDELQPGDLVLFVGLGGGVSLACAVWQVP